MKIVTDVRRPAVPGTLREYDVVLRTLKIYELPREMKKSISIPSDIFVIKKSTFFKNL